MNNSVRIYLSAYNLFAWFLWLFYFIAFVVSGFNPRKTEVVVLLVAQGMALLEILHTILGWVKSPIVTTAAQVSSRILVLLLIAVFVFRANQSNIISWGIILISIAWSMTELVRYSFYYLSLRSKPPFRLLWMRYSFFIGLYPIGVIGEWLIIGGFAYRLGIGWNVQTILAFILLFMYAYYFPALYGYMWKQRKNKLRLKKSEDKNNFI